MWENPKKKYGKPIIRKTVILQRNMLLYKETD